MSKKEKKYRDEDDMVITKETQQKWERAARRKIKLESRNFIRGGIHKTSKKDADDLESNTISEIQLQEILEEEVIWKNGVEIPDRNIIFLLSENGILSVEIQELCKVLAEYEKTPPEIIEEVLKEQVGTLIDIPIYLPKRSIITNRSLNYSLLCLIKNFHRKTTKYVVVSPILSEKIINEFWSDLNV